MSVTTTWDERKDDLEKSLRDAKTALREMTDPDTWGYSEVNSARILEYEEMYMQILQMLKKL